MLLTLLLALIFIAAVFGALYAIVGLIQNRKLMTTADTQTSNYGGPISFLLMNPTAALIKSSPQT